MAVAVSRRERTRARMRRGEQRRPSRGFGGALTHSGGEGGRRRKILREGMSTIAIHSLVSPSVSTVVELRVDLPRHTAFVSTANSCLVPSVLPWFVRNRKQRLLFTSDPPARCHAPPLISGDEWCSIRRACADHVHAFSRTTSVQRKKGV